MKKSSYNHNILSFFDFYRQKELFQSQQERMAKILAKASEGEAKKMETYSKRVLTMKEEEMMIENMMITREFKGFVPN